MHKAVVLTPQVYENLLQYKQDQPKVLKDPTKQKLYVLEDELHAILNNSDLNIHEKVLRYQYALQKLMTEFDHYKKGLTIETKTEDEEEAAAKHIQHATPTEDKHFEMLKNLLPRTLQTGGLSIYKAFKLYPSVKWDSITGEVSVEDATIPGSNIVDIVADLARRWKRNAPIGWYEIRSNIKRKPGFPKSVIVNHERLADLYRLPGPSTPARVTSSSDSASSDGSTSSYDSVDSSDSTRSKRKRKKRASNDTWRSY